MNKLAWKVVTVTTAVFAAVGFLTGITTPKTYTAAGILAPEVVNRQLPLKTLTGLSGDVVGRAANYSSDAVKIYFYPTIVTSTPFLLKLLKTPVTTSDGLGLTLEEYLDHHQKSSLVSKIKEVPRKILPKKKKDVAVSDSLAGSEEVYYIPEELYDKTTDLCGGIIIGVNHRNRKITCGFTCQDPLVAYQVCRTIIEMLDNYIRDYRRSKFEELYVFLQEYVGSKRQEALQAQARYAAYADAHLGIHTEEAAEEMISLEAEKNLAVDVLMEVEATIELVRLRMEKPAPVFEVINPPFLPVRASGPTPWRDALALGILGLIISGSVVFLEDKLFRK